MDLWWNTLVADLKSYVAQHSHVYHVIEYNSRNNMKITIEHGELQPQRQGNIVIMELALSCFNSAIQFRSIQSIHQFIGVVHLSDICTTD